MEMITLTESAVYEIVKLSKAGFDVDITECYDGQPIIVMTDGTGLVRLFTIERSTR